MYDLFLIKTDELVGVFSHGMTDYHQKYSHMS